MNRGVNQRGGIGWFTHGNSFLGMRSGYVLSVSLEVSACVYVCGRKKMGAYCPLNPRPLQNCQVKGRISGKWILPCNKTTDTILSACASYGCEWVVVDGSNV